MDKFAQRRNIFDKIREKTNITGIAAEKFFSKDFEKAMTDVRAVDTQVREIMMGGTTGMTMKDLLAEVKGSINRREYIEAFTELGKIHAQATSIKSMLDGLKYNVENIHHDILLRNYKDNDKLSEKEKEVIKKRREDLLALQKRLANSNKLEMIKRAGLNSLMDIINNISTNSGRAAMAWEKKYPQEVQKWRSGTSAMLDEAKNIYSLLIDQLKLMAKARNVRNLDKYLEASSVVSKPIADFDKNFKKYYQDAIQPLIKKLELVAPAQVPPAAQNMPSESTSNQEVKKLNDQEVLSVQPDPFPEQKIDVSLESLAPGTNKSPGVSSSPQTEDALRALLNKGRLPLPSSKNDEESGPPAINNPFPLKSSHEKFYRVLNKFSDESPLILKSMIKKYAASIKVNDFETSLKLMAIANKIKAGD